MSQETDPLSLRLSPVPTDPGVADHPTGPVSAETEEVPAPVRRVCQPGADIREPGVPNLQGETGQQLLCSHRGHRGGQEVEGVLANRGQSCPMGYEITEEAGDRGKGDNGQMERETLKFNLRHTIITKFSGTCRTVLSAA